MFSVVVPAYNKEGLIGRTIDSVLCQSYANFELIIVDDGSNDETAERVLQYQDSRIVLIKQTNIGEGGARNTGMARASHPWIAFLDADDCWYPNHLSELSAIISSFSDVGMVATSFVSGTQWHAPVINQRTTLIERVDYFEQAGREIGVVCSSTAAIRRDLIKEIGGFGNFRRGADHEYWVRAALRTPVARSTRITAYYYRHEGGIMTSDHNRNEIAPEKIEDMWPSVAIIRSVANEPEYVGRRYALNSYERNATFLSMIGYISRGEMEIARRLSRSLPGYRFDKTQVIATLLILPLGFTRMIMYVRRFLRRNIIR